MQGGGYAQPPQQGDAAGLELGKVSDPGQVSVAIGDDSHHTTSVAPAAPPSSGGCCSCCCCCCKCAPAGPRSKEDDAIVASFQDKRRYGLPATDGNIFSNWVCYVSNQDALLAILFKHPKNIYGRFKRFTLQFCIVAFTLFINASFTADSAWAGIIVSILVLQPISTMLDTLARLDFAAHEGGSRWASLCMCLARFFRDSIFWVISSSFLTIFLVLAILAILGLSKDGSVQRTFVKNILVSIFVSAAKQEILDLPNWFVDDWKLVPLLCGFEPRYSYCDLLRCKKGGLLFLVGEAVGFPKSTIGDDRRRFEETYPSARHHGVVSVDDPNLFKAAPDVAADAGADQSAVAEHHIFFPNHGHLFSFLWESPSEAKPDALPTQEPAAP